MAFSQLCYTVRPTLSCGKFTDQAQGKFTDQAQGKFTNQAQGKFADQAYGMKQACSAVMHSVPLNCTMIQQRTASVTESVVSLANMCLCLQIRLLYA